MGVSQCRKIKYETLPELDLESRWTKSVLEVRRVSLNQMRAGLFAAAKGEEIQRDDLTA